METNKDFYNVRTPGFYWVQWKSRGRISPAKYTGHYGDYGAWMLMGGRCVDEKEIFRISKKIITPPKRLKKNPQYIKPFYVK
jgi:hypothetical protein